MDQHRRQTTAGSTLLHQSASTSLLDAMAMLLDQGALAQLTGVLELADRPDTESQRQVVEQLDYFSKSVPELPAYLAHVFALARDQRELVRVRDYRYQNDEDSNGVTTQLKCPSSFRVSIRSCKLISTHSKFA